MQVHDQQSKRAPRRTLFLNVTRNEERRILHDMLESKLGFGGWGDGTTACSCEALPKTTCASPACGNAHDVAFRSALFFGERLRVTAADAIAARPQETVQQREQGAGWAARRPSARP